MHSIRRNLCDRVRVLSSPLSEVLKVPDPKILRPQTQVLGDELPKDEVCSGPPQDVMRAYTDGSLIPRKKGNKCGGAFVFRDDHPEWIYGEYLKFPSIFSSYACESLAVLVAI